MKINKKTFFSIIVGSSALLALFTGCGPKETQSGLTGAAIGGILGAAVAGDEGEGAIVGATIGGLIGKEIGRAEDEKVKENEHRQEVEQLRGEKRRLERELDRWCESCGRQVRIRGAQSCPDCGGKLIQELFCERCKSTFKPNQGYRYCPYCRVKVKLRSM